MELLGRDHVDLVRLVPLAAAEGHLEERYQVGELRRKQDRQANECVLKALATWNLLHSV